MQNKGTRKLAVVMFADITGYTTMVQNDESVAMAKVAIHRKVLEESTEQYGGQVIAFYGDGSLSTYPSAIEAVNCALKMQERYRKENVPVRIGLHLGDIVFRDGSVFGDGVNIASRIEAQGMEGSILISDKLQHEIVNHPNILTRSLGNYNLKNVKEPVKIFAIANDGLNIPKGKGSSGKALKWLKRASLPMVILLFIAYFLYDSDLFKSGSTVEQDLRTERVAVRFQDFAKIPEHLELSGMASHWIGNRLRAIPDAQVVNYEDALNEPNIMIASAGLETRNDFAKKTRAVNVLEGTIYRTGDKLLFEAHLYNLETGESERAFEIVECSINDPMVGISTLGNKVLGWWASQDANVHSVPTYDAYQLYLSAREVWKGDVELAEGKLKESISLDTSFIEAYFLLTELYSSQNSYFIRDSCIALINSRFPNLTPRQRSLLDVYEADADGDLLKTYSKYQVELSVDPFDVFVNTAGMVQAIQNANLPRKTIELFNMIPMSSMNLKECTYCQTRPRYATIAYTQLGEIDSAKYTASLIPMTSLKNMGDMLLPHIITKDTSHINALISSFSENSEPSISYQLYPVVAWGLKLLGEDHLVEYYCNTILPDARRDTIRSVIIESNYILGEYKEVVRYLKEVWPLERYSSYDYVLIYTSRAYAHAGSNEDRNHVIEIINELDNSSIYNYGKYKYMLGVMSMIEGDKEKALKLLELAFNEGYRFDGNTYQNDIDLMPLFNDPRFISLVNPLSK